MEIKTLEIEGYGKLRNLQFTFRPGLNIIYGTNETGKTTVTRCLLALLYGQEESGNNKTDEKNLMKPWEKASYKAEMEYSLGGLMNFRVNRDFETNSVKVFDAVNNFDITNTFDMDPRGEPRFAIRHLGLSQSNFLSTVLMPQGEIARLDDIRDLSSRILTTSETSVDESTFIESICKLEKALDEIGTETNPSTPLGKIAARLDELQEGAHKSEIVRKEILSLEKERSAQQQKLEDMEDKNCRHSYIIRHRELERCKSIIQQVKETEEEIEKTRKYIDDAGKPQSISKENRRILYTLQADLRSGKERLKSIEKKQEELNESYKEVQSALSDKGSILHVDKKILDQLNEIGSWDQARAAVLETRKKTLEESRKKAADLKEKYDGEKDKFTDLQSIERFEEKIADIETRRAKKEVVILHKEKRNDLKRELIEISSRIRKRFITSLLLLSISGLLLYWMVDKGELGGGLTSITSDKALFLIALAVMGLCILLWISNISVRKEANIIKNNLDKLDKEIKDIENDIENAQNELKDIFDRTGALTIEDARKKFRLFIRTGHDLEYLENIVKETERKMKKDEEEYAGPKEFKTNLMALGYISPGDSVNGDVVKKFQDDFMAVQNLQTRKEELKKQYRTLDDEHDEIEKSIEKLNQQINQILSDGSVSSAEEYDQALEQRNDVEKLNTSLKSLEEKRKILLGVRSLENYETRYNRLEIEISALLEKNPKLAELEIPSMDPDKLQEEIEALQPRLLEIKTLVSTLESRIGRLKEEQRDNSSLEETFRLRKRMEGLQKHRRAIQIAIDTIRAAGVRFHRQFLAPRLSGSIMELLKKITNRYEDIIIDEEFNISVKTREHPAMIPSASLSRGARDELYLCLRVALVRMLSIDRLILPLIMDAPLVQVDQARKDLAMELLLELGRERQVILLTGSRQLVEDYRKLMDKQQFRLKTIKVGEMELLQASPPKSRF